jgi:cytochrome c553
MAIHAGAVGLRALSFAAFVLMLLATVAAAADDQIVDFDREIRPILSENCFRCHGPDEESRQAELRLDTKEGALSDGRIVVARAPAESELYRRITSDDADERMPPADEGAALSRDQIETIRHWIEQGAQWRQHWAFEPPARPPLPAVRDAARPRTAIDRFVLARLERERLAPSPEADKATLLRRVTLDLTGLPPTPAEVDAFLADRAPDAYERLVDRLLASPRYGERMATLWLDAARYADTSGYQSDGPRHMWRWRDWVLDALNSGMPFDRFTIEQIAGDLLPAAAVSQRVATGFNRNHRGNAEGGIIPEEYAVEYVVDRVDTTSTVWLGLTLACARCHDHKYDPLSQRDFYRLFAYFNNVPEHGRALKDGNSPPYIAAPTEAQREQLAQLDARIADVAAEVARVRQRLQRKQAAWEAAFDAQQRVDWSLDDGLIASFPLDGDAAAVAGSAAEAFRDGDPQFCTGALGMAGEFDGRRFIEAGDVADFGYFDKFSLAAWVRSEGKLGGTILSRMTDEEQGDGYSVRLADGRVHVDLVKRWLDDSIRVKTRERLPAGEWHHVLVTYDGSRLAEGVTIYLDGRPAEKIVELDFINQSFAAKAPLRIGGGNGPEGRFHGAIDDVRVFDRCLEPREAAIVAARSRIDEIVALPSAKRSEGEAAKLRAYFLASHAPRKIRNAHQQLAALRRERAQLVESLPSVMVMQELPQPRPSYILKRGQYDAPGEEVSPSVPAALPPLPEGAPQNRLGLAEWLVDDANPLTARVAVNRAWQALFGQGLVSTAEDFGVQGERPTHAELLDWLAVEFRESGWDTKRLHRQIVTSAVYRQSSRTRPELTERDPANRLLARGPRFRLSAQMVRDQALAAAGLLVEQVGGPSVKPYQPPGLWEEVSGATYEQDHGTSLYRRSLYTYFKRTAAPPGMIAFDAAGRETCIVRPARTNTPLQALVTLNDTTFVEAARKMAERVLREGGDSPDERIDYAVKLILSRPPNAIEESIFRNAYRRQLARFQQQPDEAAKLLSVGESPADASLDPAELAACAVLCNLILNLDETLTRQ